VFEPQNTVVCKALCTRKLRTTKTDVSIHLDFINQSFSIFRFFAVFDRYSIGCLQFFIFTIVFVCFAVCRREFFASIFSKCRINAKQAVSTLAHRRLHYFE